MPQKKKRHQQTKDGKWHMQFQLHFVLLILKSDTV